MAEITHYSISSKEESMPINTEINAEVAQELAKQNPTIKAMIVKINVDNELEKRKTIALKALRKVEQLNTNLAEMKQEAVYDDAGKATVLGWTEHQNQIRTTTKQELEKYEAALVQALGEKADWTAVTALVR